ncbi:hypothetical protein BJX64DRAFT_230304 [Aspergillus heterothallicus]
MGMFLLAVSSLIFITFYMYLVFCDAYTGALSHLTPRFSILVTFVAVDSCRLLATTCLSMRTLFN